MKKGEGRSWIGKRAARASIEGTGVLVMVCEQRNNASTREARYEEWVG
ncbi:MAG: hypothetical protein WB586_03875 [Chthoniobacterales bacterium]